jgi:hypothetical protein
MESSSMSEASDAAPSRLPFGSRSSRKLRCALALAALGLLLGGCGNCGGWTNPWSRISPPHSCASDHASEQAMAAPIGD